METPQFLNELAESVGGKITEVGGPLPDGSGFAIMSMPLRKDHWIYNEDGSINAGEPPMPLRMGLGDECVFAVKRAWAPKPDILSKDEMADLIRNVGKYAVRASTMCGKEMDFDPDAMLQNLVVGFLGYWTDDGLSHIS